MNSPTPYFCPPPIPLDGSSAAADINYDVTATEQKQTQDGHAGQLLMPLNPALSINSDNDINNTTMSPATNNTNICDNGNGGEPNFYSNVYQQIDCFSTNMETELQELEQLLGADVLELLNDPNDYEDIDDNEEVDIDGQVDSSENNNMDSCDVSMKRLSIGHGALTQESVAKVHAVSSYVKELLKDDSYRSNHGDTLDDDIDEEKDSGEEEEQELDRKQSQSPTTPSSVEDENVLLSGEDNKKVHGGIEQPILTESQGLDDKDVKKKMENAVLNGKDVKVDCSASSQLVKLAEPQSTKSTDDKEVADSEGLNDTPVAEDEDVVSTNDEEDKGALESDIKENKDVLLDGEVESSEHQPSGLTESLKATPVSLESKKEHDVDERQSPTPVTDLSIDEDETNVSDREPKEDPVDNDEDVEKKEVNGIGVSINKPETVIKKQTTAKQIDMTWNKSPVTTKTTKQPTEGMDRDGKEARQKKEKDNSTGRSQRNEPEKSSSKQQSSKLIDMTRNIQRRSPKPPKKQSTKLIDMTRNVKTPRSDTSPAAVSVKKDNPDESADKTIVESSNSEPADISTKKEPKLIDMKRNGGRNTPNKLTNNNKKKRQEREKAAQEAPPKQLPTAKKIHPSRTKPQDDLNHTPPTSKPQAAKLIDMKPRRKAESRQNNNDESKSSSSGEKSQSKKASQQRPPTNGQQGRGSNYTSPVNDTSGRVPSDRRRVQVPTSMQIQTTRISTNKKETLAKALARPNKSPIISEKSTIRRSARDPNTGPKRVDSRNVSKDPSKSPKPPERKQIMDPRRNNTGRQKTGNRVDNESASSKLTYQLSSRQKKQIQESLDRAKRNFLLSL